MIPATKPSLRDVASTSRTTVLPSAWHALRLLRPAHTCPPSKITADPSLPAPPSLLASLCLHKVEHWRGGHRAPVCEMWQREGGKNGGVPPVYLHGEKEKEKKRGKENKGVGGRICDGGQRTGRTTSTSKFITKLMMRRQTMHYPSTSTIEMGLRVPLMSSGFS